VEVLLCGDVGEGLRQALHVQLPLHVLL
jgi:hypothetical protein